MEKQNKEGKRIYQVSPEIIEEFIKGRTKEFISDVPSDGRLLAIYYNLNTDTLDCLFASKEFRVQKQGEMIDTQYATCISRKGWLQLLADKLTKWFEGIKLTLVEK